MGWEPQSHWLNDAKGSKRVALALLGRARWPAERETLQTQESETRLSSVENG
jgi:hypothetical protein